MTINMIIGILILFVILFFLTFIRIRYYNDLMKEYKDNPEDFWKGRKY